MMKPDFKVFVGNPEMSKLIQEHLETLGFGEVKKYLLDIPYIYYLYYRGGKFFACGETLTVFLEDEREEITVSEILSWQPEKKESDLDKYLIGRLDVHVYDAIFEIRDRLVALEDKNGL